MSFYLTSLSNKVYYYWYPNPDRPEGPASQLHHDTIVHIFSNLDFKQFSRTCTVAKSWNKAANDPYLLKNAFFHEIFFTPLSWNTCFGDGCVPVEESLEAFNSLPQDIGKIGKSMCKESKTYPFWMSRTNVWFPKTIFGKPLTLLNFIALFNKRFPGILKILNANNTNNTMVIENDPIDDTNKIDNSGWASINLDHLVRSGPSNAGSKRASEAKTFRRMQKMIAELNMTVPSALQMLVCLNAIYLPHIENFLPSNSDEIPRGFLCQSYHSASILKISLWNKQINIEDTRYANEGDGVSGIEKL